tara:strand:+ start:2969 stop:4420 length:1452 start_codon:yes stop_codon:yes gene_type:complete
MTTSIIKSSKSLFVKVLVGIIILPFVFWGMGDVFRGGNQNVIATVDSEKISTQEFVNYVNRLNLENKEIKNLKNSNLLENILSEYIGRKVMALEIKKSGINVSDRSLKDIIINDKLFFKNDKFSRIEYEKFLLNSNVTAPAFEENIVKQESRRQFLGFISGGLAIPINLVKNEFKKENQIKKIEYINLEEYYSKFEPKVEKIKKFYLDNKEIFVKELKSIKYAEITPKISGNNNYDESFFKQLDEIENKVLDGQLFEETVKENDLKVLSINKVDKGKKDLNNNEIKDFPDELFKKFYAIKNVNQAEVIKINNKYYLAVIKSVSKENRSDEDPFVVKLISEQLKFRNKITNNNSILKEIESKKINKEELKKIATKRNLQVINHEINNIKKDKIFSEDIIKQIFLIKDNESKLITNSKLSKTFLVLSIKTKFKDLEKGSNDFEKYEAKARLNLINNIYKTFDASLNKKYKVELNKKTIDRVKNSF